MTAQAIDQFRKRVNEDRDLQPRFLQAYAQGAAALAALGQEQGYEFSEAEAAEAIEQRLDQGELSEFELELVAGGGEPGCDGVKGTGRSPPGPSGPSGSGSG